VKSQPDMNMIATSSITIIAVLKDGFTPDMAGRIIDCLDFL